MKKNQELNSESVEKSMDRFDGLRMSNGQIPTAKLRLDMQKTMQADAAVFRSEETLANGCKKWKKLRQIFQI